MIKKDKDGHTIIIDDFMSIFQATEKMIENKEKEAGKEKEGD